jgi:hypothetical protein
MPETKAQRSAAAKRGAATRKSRMSERRPEPTAVDRTTELADEVLKSVESGQRAAIEAVRKFVDTVDQALPAHGEGPSRRQDVVDAAMDGRPAGPHAVRLPPQSRARCRQVA